MPNRIIKESIWTSPNLNNLSDLAERHFYRLLPLPDDFGCFQSTPLVVKGKCYPLKPVQVSDIKAWNTELSNQGIVCFWEEEGREYGQFINWDKHQRVRSLHQRKTPIPPEKQSLQISDCTEKKHIGNHSGMSIDDTCRHLSSNDRPNPNPNLLKEKEYSSKKLESKPKKSKLCDEEFWNEVRKIYTWVDIDLQIKKMKGYQLTPRGKSWKMTRRSVIGWLNRIDKPLSTETQEDPYAGLQRV